LTVCIGQALLPSFLGSNLIYHNLPRLLFPFRSVLAKKQQEISLVLKTVLNCESGQLFGGQCEEVNLYE
jgi:hypothetical protein